MKKQVCNPENADRFSVKAFKNPIAADLPECSTTYLSGDAYGIKNRSCAGTTKNEKLSGRKHPKKRKFVAI